MSKFKEWLGTFWGKTTTIILGIGMTMQGILADPGAQAFVNMVPWMPRVVAIIGLLVVVARTFAPPPASVAIPSTARATVLGSQTIMIESEVPLTDAVVKAADNVDDVPAAMTAKALPK